MIAALKQEAELSQGPGVLAGTSNVCIAVTCPFVLVNFGIYPGLLCNEIRPPRSGHHRTVRPLSACRSGLLRGTIANGLWE